LESPALEESHLESQQQQQLVKSVPKRSCISIGDGQLRITPSTFGHLQHLNEIRDAFDKMASTPSLPQTQAETLFSKSLKIAAVVGAYWTVSISMVFLNKYLLSSADVRLEAPIFITWFQCFVAVATLYLLGSIRSQTLFPPFEVKLETCKKVLPLSCIFVGMIVFNNLCLKYVEVSFYNVGRSLTTVFNVILTYFLLNVTTSVKALLCCGVIVSGFALGIDQEIDVSYLGVFFGVTASCFVALNSIFVKKALPFVDHNEWKLTLYNNVNGTFIFLPVILVSGEMSTVFAFQNLYQPYFWFMMVVSGIFGVAIAVVTMMQIKFTSPLTHNISGTTKACFQTVLAVSINDETKTGLWWLSNLFVLGGSAAYTNVRASEMRALHLAVMQRMREEQKNNAKLDLK